MLLFLNQNLKLLVLRLPLLLFQTLLHVIFLQPPYFLLHHYLMLLLSLYIVHIVFHCLQPIPILLLLLFDFSVFTELFIVKFDCHFIVLALILLLFLGLTFLKRSDLLVIFEQVLVEEVHLFFLLLYFLLLGSLEMLPVSFILLVGLQLLLLQRDQVPHISFLEFCLKTL
mmetsp:Transcript_41182/g.39685  ORF Transcript_41182/g.39685 Transcript_41182/m.39685 type:complete len:170 (-) Transcript_41182:985-1494(-)